jgi:hypothetical protein
MAEEQHRHAQLQAFNIAIGQPVDAPPGYGGHPQSLKLQFGGEFMGDGGTVHCTLYTIPCALY